jgi:hypothetical protein
MQQAPLPPSAYSPLLPGERSEPGGTPELLPTVQHTKVPAQPREPVVVPETPVSPSPSRHRHRPFLPVPLEPEQPMHGAPVTTIHGGRSEQPPPRSLVPAPPGTEQPVQHAPERDRRSLVKHPDPNPGHEPAETRPVPSDIPASNGTTTAATPAVPKEPQGDPGRNSTDKVHAYNVWMFEQHGQLVSGTWMPKNARKFKSYIKTHPPKLRYNPTDGWQANPA